MKLVFSSFGVGGMQAAISRHRGKLGAPTMMEILTNPGWDEKVHFSHAATM